MEKYEIVQRIRSHYVGDECIQSMIPHYASGITVLNSDEITYHYFPLSNTFINKYSEDERKDIFPYSQIETHYSLNNGRIVKYINHLYEYGRVYLELTDNYIKEVFCLKDGDEALLAISLPIFNKDFEEIMTRNEVENLINSADCGCYNLRGGYYPDVHIASNEELINYQKERLKDFNSKGKTVTYNELESFIERSIESITIADVPSGINLVDNMILISSNGKNDKEIDTVKLIRVDFEADDCFLVKCFSFQAKTYTLEELKELEKANPLVAGEPKIPILLNLGISRGKVKAERQKVLEKINEKEKINN